MVKFSINTYLQPVRVLSNQMGFKEEKIYSSETELKLKQKKESMNLIDEELNEFLEYCKTMNFSTSEMECIFAPVENIIPTRLITKMIRFCLYASLFLGTAYGLTSSSFVTLHASAMGRIAMIKLIPYWDWQQLFYEPCIIHNPFYGQVNLSQEDCISCEAIDTIDFLQKINYDNLVEDYISQDLPAIIVDGMDNWPLNPVNIDFENVTEIFLEKPELEYSSPCVITSNIKGGSGDFLNLLKRINNPNSKKWFMHWQNCDMQAVKALRKIFQKPYFLSNSVPPAHFSWVFLSSDYNSESFRKIDLDIGLVIVAQLKGEIHFKLSPQEPCNETCPKITGTLKSGEMLVFTTFLWHYEYHPGLEGENISILTETAWDISLQ